MLSRVRTVSRYLQSSRVSIEVVVVPSESIKDPSRPDVDLVKVVERLAAGQEPVSKWLQREWPVEELQCNGRLIFVGCSLRIRWLIFSL